MMYACICLYVYVYMCMHLNISTMASPGSTVVCFRLDPVKVAVLGITERKHHHKS